MGYRLQASFSDATGAQLAVSRILELGGHPLDINASYDGVVRPEAALAPVPSKKSLGMVVAAGLSWLARPRLNISATAGSSLNPLAAVAGGAALWLGSKLLGNGSSCEEEPTEDFGDGAAHLAVYPSRALDVVQLRQILETHGGQVR